MRSRFAPSPTGPLHLGNARTALVAWAMSQAGGFILRNEDLDLLRSRPEYAHAQMEELRWIGLDWDEGPDKGGPYAPYSQSERNAVYQQALEHLLLGHHLFACYLTRRELRGESMEVLQRAQERSSEDTRNVCAAPRHRPKETTVPHNLRFHAGPGPYSFIDLVHGPQVLSPANITGDFTIKRADGIFAYHLTVTVDDAAMDISLVVRGDDLLPVTAAHLELQAALGLPTPRYAHIPLLLDTLGRPLAKRRGAPSLSELRAKGVTAERVVGLLAYSLGILPKPMRLSTAEFKAIFTLNKISKSPHRLLPSELSWLLY